MFNGIIYSTGIIKSVKKNTDSFLISVKTKLMFSRKDIGSSVSCNGVCLTIVNIKKNTINFYISKETLNRSNFKSIKKKQIINLEKSLSYGQKISGHFTQGHVDTVAKVRKIFFLDKTWIIDLTIKNKEFNKYIVEKASISINGVSLTVSKVFKNYFEGDFSMIEKF